jgi:cell wall-associated NlpC family hydrolase
LANQLIFKHNPSTMQHRSLTQACTRVVAGMFIGVLFAAAPGAFADEAGSYAQNVSFSTSSGSIPSLNSQSQANAQPAASGGGAKSFLSGVAGKAGDVVVGALNMIGVRYRWGGNSPDSGLDCSGFVRYVFQDTLGMSLPRRAEEMSRVGEKVQMSELKPGDLVFFNTMRRTFSHVGIYIGDNKFVHSPSTGSTVRVDDLDSSYWEKRFTGARRLETQFPMQADELRQRVRATIGDGTTLNGSN